MKTILLKVGEKPRVVELSKEHDYKDIKKLLEIDSPLTCIERKINGTYFDIWADDEGLLKEEKFITAILMDKNNHETLVGNILITHHDNEGATTGLSDEEINKLTNFVKSNCLIDNENFLWYNKKVLNRKLKPSEDGNAHCIFVSEDFGEMYLKNKGCFYTYTL